MKRASKRGFRALVCSVAASIAALGLVGVAPPAWAAVEVSGDWAYEVSGDSATITAWSGNCNDHRTLWPVGTTCASISTGGTLTIPATLGGKPVTAIAGGAIQANGANRATSAAALVIPSTVTSIGANSLTRMEGLTEPDPVSRTVSVG